MKSARPRRLRARARKHGDAISHAVNRAELLALIAAEIAHEQVDPAEAAVLISGRLDEARRVARTVWIRAAVENSGCSSLPAEGEPNGAPVPRRPEARLSRLNVSPVAPQIVPKNPPRSPLRLIEVSATAQRAYRAGASEPQLLDLFATCCGLDWSTAATMVRALTNRTIAPEMVAAAEQARQFWNLYAAGRARLIALQRIGGAPRWDGDCAYFNRHEFSAVVPGAVLPDHFRRLEFVTRYVAAPDEQTLDVYDIQGKPLFRHPFVVRFPLLADARIVPV